MSYLLVADLKLGMDRRRPQATGVPGTLWKAENGFVNRGGDFERAKLFDPTYTLPSGTFGLAELSGQLYVFGSASAPTMPVKVQYQRLQAGGTRATGSVTITAGSASPGVNKVSTLTVNGVTMLSAAVDWITSHSVTATNLATAINSGPQAANYSAIAVGAVVTITARTYGDAPNGYVVATTVGGTVTTTTSNMAGGATAGMTRVVDAKAFDGALYVVAEFDDGGTYHFYAGSRVTDWDAISDANSDFAAVAEALALRIEQDAAVNAVAVGDKVIITAAVPGTAFTCVGAITDNGGASTPAATATQLTANVAEVIEVIATGSVVVTGGTSAAANKITSVTVNGVELLNEEVEWISSNSATANALAIAINNYSATSGYTATAVGTGVTITAATGTGATPNGYVVAVTAGGDVTTSKVDMAGGVTYVAPVAQVYQVVIGSGTFDAEDLWKITINATLYQTTGRGAGAGTSIFVHKGRVWSTARSLVRYCVLDDATDWTTTTTPATDSGFINISTDSEGSQRLVGMAVYQGNAAIFSRGTVLIYALSADATEISLVDTLEQTGTMAARAVVPYGNLDVYYLDESGVRSIRSRDGYNAAYVSDVGNAIDSFVQEWLAEVSEDTLARAIAVIDPIDGRYLLAIDDRIFGLSYYPTSKITAWSYVDPGFSITDMIRVQRLIYARAANTVYCYGGEDGDVYPDEDEQVVVLETPFMSANDPAGFKGLTGFDMAGENDWLVEVLVDPNDTTKAIQVGVVNEVTYNKSTIAMPGVGSCALLAVRFTCSAAGRATLSNFALHYEKQGAT